MPCTNINPGLDSDANNFILFTISCNREVPISIEYVVHVSIVFDRGTPDESFIVCDWPQSFARPHVEGKREYSPAREEGADYVGVILGRPKRDVDWDAVYMEAKRIIETTPEDCLTGMYSDLYCMHPAKNPHFQFHDDPTRVIHFRGSCVGFAVHCLELVGEQGFRVFVSDYRLPKIGLKRFATISGGLTFADAEKVCAGQRRHQRSKDCPVFEGPPLYRMLLPGYLLSACDQHNEIFPFKPSFRHGIFRIAEWRQLHQQQETVATQ